MELQEDESMILTALLLTAVCIPLPVCDPSVVATPTVALVQSKGDDLSTTATPSLAFSNVNAAGHSIAVVVRAGGHSGHVLAATDTQGNTYANLGSLESGSAYSLVMFYAEGIKAGPNTVTVTDSTAAGPIRMVIREYAGVGSPKAPATTATGGGTVASMAIPEASGLLISGVVTSSTLTSFVTTPASEVEAVTGKLFVQHGATSAAMSSASSWASLTAEFEAGGTSTPCETPTPVLTWDPVPDADVAGYSIWYNEPGGTPQKLRDLPCEMHGVGADAVRMCRGPDIWTPLQREHDFTPGVAYEFRVKAYDVAGNESLEWSNVVPVCFRPLCVRPGPCS